MFCRLTETQKKSTNSNTHSFLQGINTSEDFLRQFNNPSNTILGTINAIYEYGLAFSSSL